MLCSFYSQETQRGRTGVHDLVLNARGVGRVHDGLLDVDRRDAAEEALARLGVACGWLVWLID